MNLKDAVKEVDNGVLLSIDVMPNAKKTEICGYNNWRKAVNLKVNAPPKGGKANRELIKFLERMFNAKVEIVRGDKSHQKVVMVKKDLRSVLEILEKEINDA